MKSKRKPAITLPPRVRVRRCNGNTSAWMIVTLTNDGTERDSYGSYATALSLDSLLTHPHAGHLWPADGRAVELLT